MCSNLRNFCASVTRPAKDQVAELSIRGILYPIMLRQLKAAFHYSSQLQTWSKTWSQACRKPATNWLKTVFFSTFHLSSTRTNQRTRCGSRPGFRQKKSKAGRKRVANPHELVENLAASLQLARIMECGLNTLNCFKKET